MMGGYRIGTPPCTGTRSSAAALLLAVLLHALPATAAPAAGTATAATSAPAHAAPVTAAPVTAAAVKAAPVTAAAVTAAPAKAAAVVPAASAADIAAGQRVFSRCASCHQIGGNATSAFGPQLTGIVGRPAGAARDFAYSPAMKSSRIVWTEQNLAAFVRDPGKVVPGTRMRFWGLSDEQQIAHLISYLRSVK